MSTPKKKNTKKDDKPYHTPTTRNKTKFCYIYKQGKFSGEDIVKGDVVQVQKDDSEEIQEDLHIVLRGNGANIANPFIWLINIVTERSVVKPVTKLIPICQYGYCNKKGSSECKAHAEYQKFTETGFRNANINSEDVNSSEDDDVDMLELTVKISNLDTKNKKKIKNLVDKLS